MRISRKNCNIPFFFLRYFIVRVNMSPNLSEVSNEPFVLCAVFNDKIHELKILEVSSLGCLGTLAAAGMGSNPSLVLVQSTKFCTN